MPGLNIGIDLGTSTVTAFVQGKGIVFSEETAICFDNYDDEIVAIGNAAGEMAQRTPETLRLIKPMSGGVISDFTCVALILEHFLNRICQHQIFRPNVIISAPSAATSPERKAIIEAACTSGAGRVSVIDEPIVSALGAGLSIENPHGVMVIDLGAGTTDIAVITMGTVAYSVSSRTAGDTMDRAIVDYLKKERNMLIGLPTAKKVKHTVGCAHPREEELEMWITGKDYVSRMPKSFSVSSTEIYHALKDQIDDIFLGIMNVLEQVPPELYSDICTEGILLTGGLSKLSGLDKELSERLNIKVTGAVDPEHCAAKGAGYILKHITELEDHGYSFREKETSR
ncbi:MAG: rod shape-determining protein [Oscillospiraceae bacterium]|nr:rod shape-determining protein [Oscillospiraceae bacterium]MDD6146166.1 rod shape-determining protein [Oscillospiraceae bacterium]